MKRLRSLQQGSLLNHRRPRRVSKRKRWNSVRGERPQTTVTQSGAASVAKRKTKLKASTIWIGSSSTTDDADEVSSVMDELEEQDLLKRDGIAIVYNPLIPNDSAIPDFDPMEISTWAMFDDGRRDVKAPICCRGACSVLKPACFYEPSSRVRSFRRRISLKGKRKSRSSCGVIWQRKKAARLRLSGET